MPSPAEDRFHALLAQESVTQAEVQAAAFAGVSDLYRPAIWKLLLGYLPRRRSERAERLARGRAQYALFLADTTAHAQRPSAAELAEARPCSDLDTDDASPLPASQAPPAWQADAELRAEIQKDIGRTHPDLNFFYKGEHTEPMARILFVFAKLNSGVRYVQGMHELLSPIWYVFATDRLRREELAAADAGSGAATVGAVAAESACTGAGAGAADDEATEATRGTLLLAEAEADSFYVFSSLMSEVREIFMPSHDDGDLGVRGMLTRFSRLLLRREPALAEHFARLKIAPDFYCFRWVTTLLTREFAFPDVVMLWDSLLADPQRFAFLLQFCVGMLRSQRDLLLRSDFNTAVKFLQHYHAPDFLQLLSAAIQVRAEDNADAASRGGPTAGEGSGLWSSPLSPPSKSKAAATATAPAASSTDWSASASAVGAAAGAAAGAFFRGALSGTLLRAAAAAK